MKYKCENELNTMSFKDFNVLEISIDKDKLMLMTNGGVAKYDNSCNETLEERYVSETEIRIMDTKIESFYLEGGRYYNADDVLLKEEPDKPIEEDKYKETFKLLKGEDATLFFIGSSKQDDGSYVYEIAIDVINDTYWIKLTGSRIIIEFDRFMNRVMN